MKKLSWGIGCLLVTVFLMPTSADSTLRVDKSNLGVFLDGHVIRELPSTVEMATCALECMFLTPCLSINYDMRRRICQLNSASKHQVDPSYLQPNNSFIYMDIDTWPGSQNNTCSSKPCSGNERCLMNGSSYVCLSTDCINPRSPVEEAIVDSGNVSMNSVRTYVCPTGKMVIGDAQITCIQSVWTTPSFICEFEDCPAPPTPVNEASIQPGSVSVGSVRDYQCPTGKMAIGDTQITCDESVWTTPSFICEFEDCPAPPTPVNEASIQPGSVSVGSVRDYQCPTGKMAIGDTQITCVESVWTTPSFICEYEDCPSPPTTFNEATIQPGPVSEGSVRNYICPNTRYPMGDAQITCVQSVWTTPSCNYVRSCSDLKQCNVAYGNGEYWLRPTPYGIDEVKIYCHEMDTASPKEYVSVDPNNNQALSGSTGANDAISYHINFSKVAVDIQTMVITRADRTFTSQTGASNSDFTKLKYGEAIDCYCESWCNPAYGYFKIDTTATGLIVDPTLEWATYGYYPLMKNFVRSTNGDVISADCGGYCGGCKVDGTMVLLQNPNVVVPTSSATIPDCT